MGDKKLPTLWLPGEEPGPYALGLPDQPAMAGVLAAYRLKMGQLPVGNKVAAVFPWLRTLQERFTMPEKRTIMRAGFPYAFMNQSDRRVLVHEIRFRNDIAHDEVSTHQTDLWARMAIPDRCIINEEWLPVHTLNTEIDRYLYANLDSFCYEIPSPYFLQRGNPFAVDVMFNSIFLANTTSQEWIVNLGLHGWGKFDDEPISLIKPIRGWAQNAGVAGQYQTVVFDEEQDRALRDAWVTHLSIGSSIIDNTNGRLQQGVSLRPQAPEGPPWHLQEFFRVDDLAEQVGALESNTTADNYVIHRPIVPYILDPGEGLRIEIWNRSAQNPVNVNITLRGTQEGGR